MVSTSLLAAALRVPLALGYPVLAHAASTTGRNGLAAAALVDLALVLLIGPLVARAPWAWALLAAVVAACVAALPFDAIHLPLLAPPVLFTGLLAYGFARSLRRPRVPVITRIMCAIEGQPAESVDPAVVAYTRRLTALWAGVIAMLCAVNAVMAVIAVPHGVLARLGIAPDWVVAQAAWSWMANVATYVLVGGLFVAEYAWRTHRFPDRPYRGFGEFLRRMGQLGPGFWSGVFR